MSKHSLKSGTNPMSQLQEWKKKTNKRLAHLFVLALLCGAAHMNEGEEDVVGLGEIEREGDLDLFVEGGGLGVEIHRHIDLRVESLAGRLSVNGLKTKN